MNENGILERTEELGEKHFPLPFVYHNLTWTGVVSDSGLHGEC